MAKLMKCSPFCLSHWRKGYVTIRANFNGLFALSKPLFFQMDPLKITVTTQSFAFSKFFCVNKHYHVVKDV